MDMVALSRYSVGLLHHYIFSLWVILTTSDKEM